MAKDINNLRVAILVAEGFEQQELTEPRKALDEAGAITQIVSPAEGEVQGWNHFDKADMFPVDVALNEANADDFDALLPLFTAPTIREARAAFRKYDSISGNFCFADVDGNIGYQYTGRIPRRPAWPLASSWARVSSASVNSQPGVPLRRETPISRLGR